VAGGASAWVLSFLSYLDISARAIIAKDELSTVLVNIDIATLCLISITSSTILIEADVGGLCLSARRWMYEEEYYRNITCTSLLIVPDAG
jgi:hypothetical protein